MTSMDRTIYRHVKRSYTTKELIEAYTPTEEERHYVETTARSPQHRLNLMLWIKLFSSSSKEVSNGTLLRECFAVRYLQTGGDLGLLWELLGQKESLSFQSCLRRRDEAEANEKRRG